jgi:hypothetical protein
MEDVELTVYDKPNGIDEWQVALKKVQPLHQSPLGFPDQIDLHSEGKNVVPNKHRRGRDCGGNKNSYFNFFYTDSRTNDQISCSTAIFDQMRESETERKLTATNLTAVNLLINEARGSPLSMIINSSCCGQSYN